MNFLDVPFILAVNKYDLIQEYETDGQQLDDYMQEEFLSRFAENNGFLNVHSKSNILLSKTNLGISVKYNQKIEELIKELIEEIIRLNIVVNPETGEHELKITALGLKSSFTLDISRSIVDPENDKK